VSLTENIILVMHELLLNCGAACAPFMHQVPRCPLYYIAHNRNTPQVIAAALQSLSFDPNYLGDDDDGQDDYDDDDGDDDDTFWKVRLVSSRLLASCARTGFVTGDVLLQTVLPPLLLRLQDRIDIVISESLVTFKECLHRMGAARQQLTPADAQRFIKCVSKESRSKDARLQENLFVAGHSPNLTIKYHLQF
jgi:hypothetical protein